MVVKYCNLKSILAALSVTSSLVIPAPALAADSGFYIGGSVGITNLDVDSSDLQ